MVLKNLNFHEMGAFSILLKGRSEAEHHGLPERQGDLLPAPTQQLSWVKLGVWLSLSMIFFLWLFEYDNF